MAATPSYDILPTPYGGRGAFARGSIPGGSPILFCPAPYAAVIYWKFRREVCATCYAYAFESGRNKWSVKLGGGKGQGGVWFCSDECKVSYVKDYEVVQGQGVGWWLEIVGVLERLVLQMARIEMQQNSLKPLIKLNSQTALAFLQDAKDSDITPEYIDRAWLLAEEVSLEDCRKKGVWTEVLTEFELDTAQFVLNGLARKAIEHLNSSLSTSTCMVSTAEGYSLGAGRWADFMELQDNELPLIKSKPYLLASRILVYRFLRCLVESPALHSRHKVNHDVEAEILLGCRSTLALNVTDCLRKSLATSADARALMARDYGNVFGIWDNAQQDEGSEMLGWGAYIFGSYFNHNCSPNLKKRRNKAGIQFYTSKDVFAGEELCISYIDEDSHPAKERGERLERDWFFVCSCARCTVELCSEPAPAA